MNKIASAFDEIAANYDQQRRNLIPCYDDFYKLLVVLSETNSRQPHILDIGAGTGLLTAFLTTKFPNANYTLIDISDEMLNVARQRFQQHSNISYIAADYKNFVAPDSFDIVVSSLSIHHLTDLEKKKLFQGVFQSLKKGGVFVNGDQFLARTAETEQWYHQLWINKIEGTTLTEHEKKAAYERMKLDIPSTVNDNISWMEEAGFVNVDLFYKYLVFGIIRGFKPI